MSVSSSTSTSLYEMENGPLPLYRVAFEGEQTAHWALFLPHSFGRVDGILVHVGVQKQDSCGTHHTGKTEEYTLKWHNFRMLRSGARSCFPIANAYVTESQLRWAAEEIFNRKSYNTLTNNCQHFCIDVVTYLHQTYPRSVPRSAVEEVLARARGLTNLTYMIRRTQLHDEESDAGSNPGDAPRFSIE